MVAFSRSQDEVNYQSASTRIADILCSLDGEKVALSEYMFYLECHKVFELSGKFCSTANGTF